MYSTPHPTTQTTTTPDRTGKRRCVIIITHPTFRCALPSYPPSQRCLLLGTPLQGRKNTKTPCGSFCVFSALRADMAHTGPRTFRHPQSREGMFLKTPSMAISIIRQLGRLLGIPAPSVSGSVFFLGLKPSKKNRTLDRGRAGMPRNLPRCENTKF